MQTLAWTCGWSAADSMTPKCRLKSSEVKSIYFNHPSQGNSTNYYTILVLRDKAAPPTSQQTGKFHPKRMKYQHHHPVLFLFLPNSQESSLCSQPIMQWQCSPNWVNIPWTCWAKLFGPQIQHHHSLKNTPNEVHKANVCPIKNKLGLINTQNMFVKQRFTQLRTGFTLTVCPLLQTGLKQKLS